MTYAVGTAVRVGPLALDGQVVRLQPVGVRRFRVLRHLADARPYPRARWPGSTTMPGTDAEGLERIAVSCGWPRPARRPPGSASCLPVGHPTPLRMPFSAPFPLPLANRQAALEAGTTAERLTLLRRVFGPRGGARDPFPRCISLGSGRSRPQLPQSAVGGVTRRVNGERVDQDILVIGHQARPGRSRRRGTHDARTAGGGVGAIGGRGLPLARAPRPVAAALTRRLSGLPGLPIPRSYGRWVARY